MATKTIFWSGNSGDRLTVTFSGVAGESTCNVSSDPNNTFQDRSKVLRFRCTDFESPYVDVTVTQTSNNITIITINNTAVTHSDKAIGYGDNI